eukprot:361602-Rhodomonas_salina.1
MSGTDIAYEPLSAYALLPYLPARNPPISLRAPVEKHVTLINAITCSAGERRAGGTESGIVLRACYAMSGTDIAYGAIWLCNVRYWPRRFCYLPTRVLCAMCGTGTAYGFSRALRCPAMSGTDIPYGAMSGTDIAYGSVLNPMVLSAYALATRCPSAAISGTDIAHGAICLRGRYAKSGTDIAYGFTTRGEYGSGQVPCALCLHCIIKYEKPHFQYNLYQECGHAMSGTDPTYCMISGTEIAYGGALGACYVIVRYWHVVLRIV